MSPLCALCGTKMDHKEHKGRTKNEKLIFMCMGDLMSWSFLCGGRSWVLGVTNGEYTQRRMETTKGRVAYGYPYEISEEPKNHFIAHIK